MDVLELILVFVHVAAFVAGGANTVVMPIIGARLPTATPEVRTSLMDIVQKLAAIGKYAMATLLVTGVLVLWLKWDWVAPNAWFWVKMALIVAMIVFIVLNARNAGAAAGGDRAAAQRSKLFGQLSGLSFIGIIFSAVMAFG